MKTTDFKTTKDLCLYLEKELQNRFPEYVVSSGGPFGLGAEWFVHVKNKDEYIGFITIPYKEPTDTCFVYKDYSDKFDFYPEDSIGALNEFNYMNKILPDDIEDVIKLIMGSF